MQYNEVKDLLEGYKHYIALMKGLDIDFKRNKRLNQFEYWVKIENQYGIEEHLLLMEVEMGDVRNKVVMTFGHASQFIHEFASEYSSKSEGFYPKFKENLNSVSFSVYNIDEIKKVLSLFENMGWFDL